MSDEIDGLIAAHGASVVSAAVAPMLSEARIARIDQVLAARLASVTVVVEDVYDPHNAAAAIRSAEALGVQDVHVIEVEHRFSKASGVSQGGDQWIDLHRWASPEACAAALRGQGFVIYAAAPSGDVDLEAIDVSRPAALLFGNEHRGLSAAAMAAADHRVSIAMAGFTESFNLSVSVALALYRTTARRRAALGTAGDLASARKAHLRARWHALKIRGLTGIVERYVAGLPRTAVSDPTQGPAKR